MANFFKAGDAVLPTPSEVTFKNEQIWSGDTGRTQSGKMTGDVVAEKITASIKWYVLSKAKMDSLKKHLKTGFFQATINDIGTVTVYRGPIQATRWNRGNGEVWYKDVTVDLIER